MRTKLTNTMNMLQLKSVRKSFSSFLVFFIPILKHLYMTISYYFYGLEFTDQCLFFSG